MYQCPPLKRRNNLQASEGIVKVLDTLCLGANSCSCLCESAQYCCHLGDANHSCRSWSAIPAPRETGTQRTNLPQDLQHFLRSTCTYRCTYTRACTEHVYVSIHVTPTEVAAIYPDGEVEVFLQNRHTTITRSLSRVSNKLEIQCVNT